MSIVRAKNVDNIEAIRKQIDEIKKGEILVVDFEDVENGEELIENEHEDDGFNILSDYKYDVSEEVLEKLR